MKQHFPSFNLIINEIFYPGKNKKIAAPRFSDGWNNLLKKIYSYDEFELTHPLG